MGAGGEGPPGPRFHPKRGIPRARTGGTITTGPASRSARSYIGLLAGSGATAGAGALVGYFHDSISKDDVAAAAAVLEAGESGLIIIAANKQGTDIEPLLSHAETTKVIQTTWGDLDAQLEKEVAASKAADAS